MDMYVANYGQDNVLYRNKGDGTFESVGSDAGVNDAGRGRGVAWGDYDGDGALDLYVANDHGQANVLYRNRGDGTFEDASGPAAANVGDMGSGFGVAWGDYDGDGALDLYVANCC